MTDIDLHLSKVGLQVVYVSDMVVGTISRAHTHPQRRRKEVLKEVTTNPSRASHSAAKAPEHEAILSWSAVNSLMGNSMNVPAS